eukprot:Gb_15323 [translate_table: standard]
MDSQIICRKSNVHSIRHPCLFIPAKFSLYSHCSRLKEGPQLDCSNPTCNHTLLRIKRPPNNQTQQILCTVSSIKDIRKHDRHRSMFIFGMGFVGQYLAEQLKDKGWRVSGTCTSEEKKRKLEEKGYEAFTFKAEEKWKGLTLTGFKALCDSTHIITSIPPVIGCGEDPVIFQHGPLLRQALSSGNISWIGYLSSTSVYGHWGGDWVDEDSPAKPVDKVGSARLDAEKAWIRLGQNVGIPVQVFRLGGIYGLGRSAIDTIIRQQKLSTSQKTRGIRCYTSRVHVADICQAILASIELPSSAKIYNVVDDDPTPRVEVFSFAKSLLEKKWPSKLWGANEIGTMASNTNAEVNISTNIVEKRVCNKRLKDELKVKLLYPNYRLGLESIIESIEHCPL